MCKIPYYFHASIHAFQTPPTELLRKKKVEKNVPLSYFVPKESEDEHTLQCICTKVMKILDDFKVDFCLV